METMFRYQKCLWDLMEKPQSGVFAKIISLFSISLVLVSTLCMCMNTMPEFKLLDTQGARTIENPVFSLVEAVCISWFTIEYFLRLAGHSSSSPSNYLLDSRVA